MPVGEGLLIIGARRFTHVLGFYQFTRDFTGFVTAHIIMKAKVKTPCTLSNICKLWSAVSALTYQCIDCSSFQEF